MMNSTYSVVSRTVSTVKKVGGHDRRGLRPQKRSPGDRRPARSGAKRVVKQHRADGGRRHADPELQEFALDAPVAPARILPGQPQDQRDYVLGERGTAGSTVGFFHLPVARRRCHRRIVSGVTRKLDQRERGSARLSTARTA